MTSYDSFMANKKHRTCYKKWLRYLSSVNPNISPAPSTKLAQTMVNSSDVPPKPNYSTQDRHVSSFFSIFILTNPIPKKTRNKYLINPNNALFFREIPRTWTIDLHCLIPSKWGVYLIYPPPSNSHHQDDYNFSRESRTKPSFVTVNLGGRSKVYGCFQK